MHHKKHSSKGGKKLLREEMGPHSGHLHGEVGKLEEHMRKKGHHYC